MQSDSSSSPPAKKKRSWPPRGELHPRAKLTNRQVREIQASPLSDRQLAKLYDVHPGTIYYHRKKKL